MEAGLQGGCNAAGGEPAKFALTFCSGAGDGIRTRTTEGEPRYQALKACVLPLHYTRFLTGSILAHLFAVVKLVNTFCVGV